MYKKQNCKSILEKRELETLFNTSLPLQANTRISSIGTNHETWANSLKTLVPFWISNIIMVKNEIIVFSNREHLYQLMYFLSNHTNSLFKSISDQTAIDYPENKKRFQLVYNILSPKYNNRLRIKTVINETTAMPSLTEIYNGIGWMERETWDMFGIYFYNHPDLRRILTDYGFDGFPLCKNFPQSGYMEVRYDDEQKRVIHEPIEITQEFRNFDILSPWVTRSHIED